MSHPEGLKIARQRIAAEAEARTGKLDLARLGLTSLPEEMFDLTHLQWLRLGEIYDKNTNDVDFGANDICGELSRLLAFPSLHTLVLRVLALSHLDLIPPISSLRHLDTGATQINSLVGVERLNNLQSLNCFSTQITSLAGVETLTNLQSLNCSSTQITSLSGVETLTDLQYFSCTGTPITSLEGVDALVNLRILKCFGTSITSLTGVETLTNLQNLDCRYTPIISLTGVETLTNLQILDCNSTKATTLAGVETLTNLEFFDCSNTEITSLAGVETLNNLQSLNCASTKITSLISVASLTNLRYLDCFATKITSLAGVETLANLRTLKCFGTPITLLAGVETLTNLKSLDCSHTAITSLTSVETLTNLQSLNCASTQITSLAGIETLTNLHNLNCSHTKITSLAGVETVTNLQSLNCSATQITSLAGIETLTNLQNLICSGPHITSLVDIATLTNLQNLNCSGCHLDDLPLALVRSPSLKTLQFQIGSARGIPTELLSKEYGDNCLPRLRAHFDDLEAAGGGEAGDVKLIVLGNGRVGKTQLVNRLAGRAFVAEADSTHGIVVESLDLKRRAGGTSRLHVWDFGGQDIYHGTHALFMKTRAVFLIVWSPESEAQDEHEHGGMRFRNRPLRYWLDYVRHLAGDNVPVLLAQTRCDAPGPHGVCPVGEADLAQLTPAYFTERVSARTGRGLDALADKLHEAVDWLHDRHGTARIGLSRLKVKAALEDWRLQDALRPPEARLRRTLTKATLTELCDDAGVVSDPDFVLDWLHHCGTVYHRPGLFNDAIVLDQAWMLDAVYAVFNRKRCYTGLKAAGGRFSRRWLESLVWSDRTEAEQELFLSFMRTCGICFVYRPADKTREIEADYLAPELLPERDAMGAEVDSLWQVGGSVETRVWRFALLHEGLIGAILSRIGANAGIKAEYWRGGVCFYETETRARAMIEQVAGDGWAGEIRLSIRCGTESGNPARLRDLLVSWINEEIARINLKPLPDAAAPPFRDDAETESAPSFTPVFAPPPPAPDAKPKWYVSYAWKDDKTVEGTKREEMVDRACEAAKARGIDLRRDKDVLKTGDSISAFMRQIAAGDRVFIFLSDKYLKSANCMHELLGLWLDARHDPDTFQARTRVFVLDDAAIWSLVGRMRYAAHWKAQLAEVEALIRDAGNDIGMLGERGMADYRRMREFAQHVGDILALFADHILSRTFAEFEAHGFDDPPTP
ncbi:MAG: leucine-rich repeat domain-containing protein [Hyphomicrobiaceae bacterium]|nr:leucine-rich repeat domain-containing protein [Hyphomicrobiaceae bacterium]